MPASSTAPVYPQVKWLHEHGVDCDVIMGSRNKDLLILEDEMRAVAANLYVTTDDGSYGFHGTGTAQLQELWDQGVRYDHCVAIGPMIMMKFERQEYRNGAYFAVGKKFSHCSVYAVICFIVSTAGSMRRLPSGGRPERGHACRWLRRRQ